MLSLLSPFFFLSFGFYLMGRFEDKDMDFIWVARLPGVKERKKC
jgi:hypothetical protein